MVLVLAVKAERASSPSARFGERWDSRGWTAVRRPASSARRAVACARVRGYLYDASGPRRRRRRGAPRRRRAGRRRGGARARPSELRELRTAARAAEGTEVLVSIIPRTR